MELDSQQVLAIKTCLDRSNRIVAVTGPAGSGKTTIIRQIVEELRERGIKTVVTAPTGKAARRITQLTGIEAVTIHKLLEYPQPGERDAETGKPLNSGQPKKDRQHPIDAEIILADEYAMVGHELHRNLVDALGRGCRLCVFGDVSQLAPVDNDKHRHSTKSPFEGLLAQRSITLETIHRQAAGSGILLSADRIRKGKMPSRYDDFAFRFTDEPVRTIKDIVSKSDASFRDIRNQIIVPSKKRWTGTHAINRLLRDHYYPNPEFELRLPRHEWDKKLPVTICVGDKIICTENTYDMRTYWDRYEQWTDDGTKPVQSTFIAVPNSKWMLNGESGVVIDILDDGSFCTDMGDRVVEVPREYDEFNYYNETVYVKDPRKSIDLAYAITTHKSQGSEYDNVIYLINKSASYMLDRRNFYTAVTRASKKVLVVTDQSSIQLALRKGDGQ